MAASDAAVRRLLDRLGVPKPSSLEFMLAVLIVSLQDWQRELKRSQRRQRRNDAEDED